MTRLAFKRRADSAGAEEDGTIRIWNVANGRLEKTLKALNEITALVFAPGGQTLATAARSHDFGLESSERLQAKFQKHDANINALAFSPDSQLLASGGDDRMIVLWEVATGKSKRTFKGHDQAASLAFARRSAARKWEWECLGGFMGSGNGQTQPY